MLVVERKMKNRMKDLIIMVGEGSNTGIGCQTHRTRGHGMVGTKVLPFGVVEGAWGLLMW
jgi:hypothetical protein